ncbi:MFS transporter [Streptomyces sp. NRRL F-2890]|uniref:MFS transporter n=1 Tax=Streptomyces sp. NRRL F-2890 TaxID=1463845 RepID=UPI000694626D|nr:MFS transporter [Streptomyces sp. NRRL F-2890]
MSRYLTTAFLARMAEEGMAVALALLALHRTGSAAQGAFVLTAWMAPHVLAAPLVGALPARWYGAALGIFATAIATLAATVGHAPLPLTAAIAVAGGSCGPVVAGGLSSLVAGLAPAGRDRTRAYGLDATVYNAASVAAPAAVGVLTALTGPARAMLALAVSAATAALLTAALPRPPAPARPPSRAGVTAAMTAGTTALWRVPQLRAVTAATSLAFLGVGGLTTTTVLLAEERAFPGGGSLLMTVFALGALAGALATARLRRPVPPARLVTVALAGTGVALGAAALAPSPVLCLPLYAFAGLCDGPLLSATLRIRADHAPDDLRAQVFTLGAGLKITAAACGAALVGLLAALPAALLLMWAALLHVAAAALHTGLTRHTTRTGSTTA